ncbi:hypothetical protein [Methanocella arvoryzae]|uniref:Glycosyltransferase RgtA/B/C/D-like domain-containing protein n=1 Tax=Methanocella arvoryzae (strain DSM 22066 / NBRC 105507 / MRE50) TaxID=351160 RepID=Q0W955_METAR|nr:hypothetical protein [Methanocella arvoryzae]CAJ35162.1 hypothetical protein LRC153 [Methanocella arvoryzae MRE50]
MSDRKAVNLILIILIAVGLLSSLLASLNLELDSDTVVPGLVAMEIVKYGNFGFTYPVDDPYLFTDIFTFHFLPQVLSGFDPTVLRLTAFFVFLLVVSVFTYMIYRFSNLTSALIFAALFTNIQPGASYLFLSPEYHVGSLLFAGLFILLFHTEAIQKLPFYAVAALAFVVGLIVLSDSIILAFFIVPYIGYCIYYFWTKRAEVPTEGSKKQRVAEAESREKEVSKITNVLVVLGISTVAAYVLKMNNFFMDGLRVFLITTKTGDVGGIGERLTLLVESLLLLLNHNLLSLLNTGINLYDIAIGAIFLMAAAYSLVRRNPKANYLYWMFMLSAGFTFVAFTFTTLGDGGSARFLLFVAVGVFATIALAYRPETPGLNVNTMLLAAVIILILATIASNIGTIAGYDYQPNKEDYELIDYLKNNSMTYGYTDFNRANKLIYLSKQEVLYPKVKIVDDQFFVEGMLMTQRWYDVVNEQHRLHVLVGENDPLYIDAQKVIRAGVLNNTHYYQNYTIYEYNL